MQAAMGSAISHLGEFLSPSAETYKTALNIFQYFPLFFIIQWLTSFHPAGKGSLTNSLLNIPGRLAWSLMELVGPVILIYNLAFPPPSLSTSFASLPLTNKLLAALYLLHYLNRAIISPWFAAPSMSPIHALVFSSAVIFNYFNGTCLSAWLLGYHIPVTGYKTVGETTPPATQSSILPTLGLLLFFLGMTGNIYSERTLFRLRREEAHARHAKKSDSKASNGRPSTTSNSNSNSGSNEKNIFHKVYVIPPARGLFRSILFPHYVCEWIEWFGFVLVGTAVVPMVTTTATAAMGGGSMISSTMGLAPWIIPFAILAEKLGVSLPVPAVVFFVNAVGNLLPHARWGRKWYVERFGGERVAGRGAVVPWCAWM